ncbi:hypothetical protein HYS28_02850 [Candidatus Uhrbacteria bacterium]|nr:hypothetical protein [Candidatus Uhrbacteria bacterium]
MSLPVRSGDGRTPVPVITALDIRNDPSLAIRLLTPIADLPLDEADEAARRLGNSQLTYVYEVVDFDEVTFAASLVPPHLARKLRAAFGAKLQPVCELGEGLASLCRQAVGRGRPAQWLLEEVNREIDKVIRLRT